MHRVSPLKSSRTTPYFDCIIQITEKTQTRGVCFFPDYHSQLKDLSVRKRAIKLTNFHVSKKFGRNDVIIDKKTIVSEAANKLSFKPLKGLDLKEHMEINTITTLANKSAVTVKGKICQLSGTKIQITRQGQLKRQVGYLVDPTASIKIVLWERFTNLVEENKTYIFTNVTVTKTSYGEIYLNTAKTGSSIDETEAFKCNLAIPEDPPEMAVQTVKAKLIGLSSISKYPICSFCSKKLSTDAKPESLVQCLSCKLFQQQSSCSTNWYFRGLFRTTDDTKQSIQLSVFNYHVTKISMAAKLNVSNVTEEEFVKLFLGIGELDVTYDSVKKVLTDAELIIPSSSAPVMSKATKTKN